MARSKRKQNKREDEALVLEVEDIEPQIEAESKLKLTPEPKPEPKLELKPINPALLALSKTVGQLRHAILGQSGRVDIKQVNSAQISFLKHVNQILGVSVTTDEVTDLLENAGLLDGEILMIGVGIWEFDVESKSAYEVLASVFYMRKNGLTIVKDNLVPKLLGNYAGLADKLFINA